MRSSLILIFIIISFRLNAQIDSSKIQSNDLFVIDSYITFESPYRFVLSFVTTDSCVSKVVFLNKFNFEISKIFTENHKFEMELSKIILSAPKIRYQIFAVNRRGVENRSEIMELEIPHGIIISPDQDPGLFHICLGGVVFAIPSPSYIHDPEGTHFGLSKEVPLINFYSTGYNYPSGYLALEYSYIFGSDHKNFLRGGYKQILQNDVIKYVSPGVSFFTDFNGRQGISAEISTGLLQIQNIFTLYARYRYNHNFNVVGLDSNELTVGLYSNFFSINL